MKTLVTFILIGMVSFSFNAQSSAAIVTYKKTTTKNIFTADKKEKLGNEKLSRFVGVEAKSNQIANYLMFTLSYKNNEATFKVNDFMETPNSRYLKLALLPFGNGEYYNSPIERIKLMDSFGEYFTIQYPENYTAWTLLKETKSIGNYTAYKAVAEEKVKTNNGYVSYNITAWYTPDVNIQYGPIGYSGLPGLILELHKKNIIYYATRIELNPKKAVTIKKPNKGIKITVEKYNEMALNAMKNFKKTRG